MKATQAWVLGRGGLLGSHLERALAARGPRVTCWDGVPEKFSWNDSSLLPVQLEGAVRAFAQAVLEGDYDDWMILWAAGTAVVGSAECALQAETKALELLLNLLDQHLGEWLPGLVFLASSAGAVYGNCPDHPITEASPCNPISAYGRNKLQQERVLQAWVKGRPHVSYLIGRISNLYGLGQNLAKPQGLISHISRSLIYRCPVHIYVSLDTIRDYIFAEDCAEAVVESLFALTAADSPPAPARRVVKIFASEQAASIDQIVGVFTRLAARQHPRVICAPSLLANQQPRRLEFRSASWPAPRCRRTTALPIGINRVHQHHLALFRQGWLSAP